MLGGMTTPAATATRPYELFEITVARRERLTSHLVRVTFAGESLHGLADRGYDQRVKLVLPVPGGDRLADFPRGDDWFGRWRALPQERRAAIRTYTVGAVRPGEVDIDMVDHGTVGPGSRLACLGEPGDEVGLIGPCAAYDGDPGGLEFRRDLAETTPQLIVGDESALPAVVGIVRALPAHATGLVCLETVDEEGRMPLEAPAGVEVRWCTSADGRGVRQQEIVREWMAGHRVEAGEQASTTVYCDGPEEAYWEVSDPMPQSETAALSAWIAGESAVVKSLRRMLVGEFRVPKSAVAFMGYWREGCAGA